MTTVNIYRYKTHYHIDSSNARFTTFIPGDASATAAGGFIVSHDSATELLGTVQCPEGSTLQESTTGDILLFVPGTTAGYPASDVWIFGMAHEFGFRRVKRAEPTLKYEG